MPRSRDLAIIAGVTSTPSQVENPSAARYWYVSPVPQPMSRMAARAVVEMGGQALGRDARRDVAEVLLHALVIVVCPFGIEAERFVEPVEAIGAGHEIIFEQFVGRPQGFLAHLETIARGTPFYT